MRIKLSLLTITFIICNTIHAQSLRNYKISLQWQKPLLAPYSVFVGVKKYESQYGIFEYLAGGGNSNDNVLSSIPVVVVDNYRDKDEIKKELVKIIEPDCKILSVQYYNSQSPFHRLQNERGHNIPVGRNSTTSKNNSGYKSSSTNSNPVKKNITEVVEVKDVVKLVSFQKNGYPEGIFIREPWKLNITKMRNNEEYIYGIKFYQLDENNNWNYIYSDKITKNVYDQPLGNVDFDAPSLQLFFLTSHIKLVILIG